MRHKGTNAASAYVGKIVDPTALAYGWERSVFCHCQVVVSYGMIAEIERVFLLGLQECLLLTIAVFNSFVNKNCSILASLPDGTYA
jgi:hypothetical protein